MDFGQLFGDAWKRFVDEIVSVVIFALVGVLLCFTIILIPTVYGGFVRGFVGLVRDGRKPELSELWNFDRYVDLALLMLVSGLLTMIGYLCLILPGLILNVWWLYAGFFLVDRGLGFWEAMGESRAAVGRTGFVNHFVLLVVLGVLGALGGTLGGFGTLLTTPFSLTLLATVYVRELVARVPGADGALAAP